MINRSISHSVLLLIALLLGGCGTTVNIPQPAATGGMEVPEAEPSIVQIPVTMNLTSIFREVEKAVPTAQRNSKDWTVVGKNMVGDIGIKYEIWRDPLQLSVQGDKLVAEARVYYWFQFAQRVPKPIIGGSFWQELASCGRGEPPRVAQVRMEIGIGWSKEWSILPQVRIIPPAFTNKCAVTFLKIDVTDRVREAFEAGLKQGGTIARDRIMKEGNFRAHVERAWNQLLTPIRLDSALWLAMGPQRAYVGPFTGSGTAISTMIGFSASPRIFYGTAPPKVSGKGLEAPVTAQGGDALRVTIDGELSYEDAGRELAKILAREPFTVAGHTIQVTGAKVYGAGKQAVVQLELAGDLKGQIYLVGAPAYDVNSNTLYIRDLDYSLETSQTLAQVAEWLLHGSFRNSMAERARWSLSGYMAQARTLLEKALNKPITKDITARAKITGIRPAAVYLTNRGFTARVVVEGSARLEVR